jgi:hypothetical protein
MSSRHFREEYSGESFPEIDDSRNDYFTQREPARPRRLYIVVDAKGEQVSDEPQSLSDAQKEQRCFTEHAGEAGYVTPLRVVLFEGKKVA